MKPLLASVILALLLVPANSSFGAKNAAERFPEFEGTIIAIELPFQAMYRAHSTVETARMDMDMKVGADAAKLRTDIKIEQVVHQKGEKLEWTFDIREMSMFGKKLRSRSPLMTARMISALNGEIEGFEIAYPGFQEAGITDLPPTPKKGTPEYDALLRQFGGVRRLPDEPVVSGSTIFTQRVSDLFGELPGIKPELLQRTVGYVVKGWGFYRDQKVIVATQTFDTPVALDGADAASMTLSGYALLDATTLARVKSDFLMIISGQSEGKPLYFRIRGASEAKFKGR